MNILIVEDEDPAADRLQKMITESEPAAVIAGRCDSVSSTTRWIKSHTSPDLIFMDIQLSDGISFEIFNQVEISCPVIFTTAYDEYALRAFKVNSIDYLLKPIKREELVSALNKFKKLSTPSIQMPPISELIASVRSQEPSFKKRFIIRYGEKIRTVSTDDIAYFYTEDKNHYLRTKDNLTLPVDYNLDKLEELLDPKQFFRINRQFIISYGSIEQMTAFSKSRIKVGLKPPSLLDSIVSSERSASFKDWLDGAN